MSETCYGVITKVGSGRWCRYNAVVWMRNGHILCAKYEFKTEDEARAWLKAQPVVSEIYVEEVK